MVNRREVRDAVVAIYRERANMASSLKDTDSIVQACSCVCVCVCVHVCVCVPSVHDLPA